MLVGLAAIAGGFVNAIAGGGTLITFPMLTAVGVAPVIANVQRLVPADSRVLMLWEARGLPLERDVLVDVRRIGPDCRLTFLKRSR